MTIRGLEKGEPNPACRCGEVLQGNGFIVSPYEFPGGNVGKLSICGTVNDLSCMGAEPLYLTCAFVIEEGFPMDKLEEIAAAMEKTAAEAAEEEAAQEAETAKSTAGSHVIAHRGSAGDDELSFAAYDKAVEAGAGYIEADMVVSADGTVYVAHEDESGPMTGYEGYFSGMSDSQIDSLTTKAGNKVLKLTDLFDKYGDSVTYIVDIKYNAPRNAEALVKTVRDYGNEKNVVAASFLPKALSAVEEELPDMTKIYLCSDQGTFNAGLGYSFADVLCVPADIMNADNLKAAHDNSKKFSAWTLNTEEEIKNAIELGVDTYFTDDSALAVRLEEENRQAE